MSDVDPLGRLLEDWAAGSGEIGSMLARLHALMPRHSDPATAEALLDLLRTLYRIARRDLPLARLFEGHVDALQIIARYAEDAVAQAVEAIAAAGGVFGVWNAAIVGEPLRVVDGRLHGGKSFASGAGILGHALAGADTSEGSRLVLIDLEASAPTVDGKWWRVVGMQRSQTHAVRWSGAEPKSFRFVGAPGDYAREPFFSGGALRFVACHAGGVAALLDHVRNHLVAAGRAADPHQAGRLAELFVAAGSAAAAVREASRWWSTPDFVEHVTAARVTVAACAENALTIAQQAIGVAGMFVDHPLSATLTDLMVYLRQPAPDAQRMRLGSAVASGQLALDL
ncbi:acyl-CoA dehydrogenase [Sphingomonas immobilis]|uniref:Acyl-CoA dehydrogenase n=1 Tax=Sphingomonas immobilis TaxID=3063997 RepID=A0ABT8ZZ77_9SPHN|nr:acyl-CoA dehydrogenase [Sphingomonas sp. CA1-15]MDO7842879.1 acyl-CoA dehydrogenase [Sphingomonas sp. CA1-15]